MKANPYSTALISIGVFGIILAMFLFFVGAAAGVSGLSVTSFAAALFSLGSVSMVGWLVLGAVQWKQPTEANGRMSSIHVDTATPLA
jgi:hypothetical protein